MSLDTSTILDELKKENAALAAKVVAMKNMLETVKTIRADYLEQTIDGFLEYWKDAPNAVSELIALRDVAENINKWRFAETNIEVDDYMDAVYKALDRLAKLEGDI